MPKLDDRLQVVAGQIRCRVHADIGSDHGQLLKSLLMSGRIDHGIAIENKRQPFRNSKTTLLGYQAEVRFADGLAGLCTGEADCISICGMGGDSICQILDAFPDRVAPTVVVQPNARHERVRAWGIRSGHHLADEQATTGRRRFTILRFERSDGSADPVYEGLELEAALMFGPHMIRRWEPDFVASLLNDQQYLQRLARLSEETSARLMAITKLLSR